MLGRVTEERIRVRYGETDMMGHAYYANYLLWFEQARGAWCRDRGFTYLQLEQAGYKLPVVEAHIRYKAEAKYDDLLVIRTKLVEVKRAVMRYEYEVFNETTGKVCTEGYTVHVLIDGQTWKSTSIPPEVMAQLERDPDDYETLA